MLPKLQLTFDEAIDAAVTSTEDMKLLPVCHNTLEGALYEIQLKNQIEGQECSVFKENLSYFFYGKASYISKHVDSDILTDDLPVTMLYDLAAISNSIHRIVPFDSGGFDRYEIKRGFKLEHFTLHNPTKEKLLKLVKSFFTTNENYLNRELAISIPTQIIDKCKPISIYIKLMQKAKSTGGHFGEQAFAFEIQFKDEKILFNPKAIIIHHSFFTKDTWEEQVKDYSQHGIALYPYGKPAEETMTLRKAYEEIEKKAAEIISTMM